jgi:hypothetical protein
MDREEIRREVGLVRDGYEKELRASQPPNWTPDRRTLDLFSIGKWLSARFEGKVSEDRRRAVLLHFGRIVRAESDPFAAAEAAVEIGDSGRELEEHYKTFFRERKRK